MAHEHDISMKAGDTSLGVDAWIDAGLQHHQAGRLRDAEAAYRQALSIRPDHPDALHLLGFVAYQCGRHSQARELISRALQIVPDAPDFHNHLGLVLAALGRPDDATSAYQTALRLRPEFPEAHNNLGILLRETGRLSDAEAHYRAAVNARPAFADAWNNLGNVCRERGDVEAAVSAYREALRQRPDFSEAHSNILFTLSHYSLAPPQEIVAAHRQWDQVHGALGRDQRYTHRRDGDPDRRLRVGYVSPDFRLHAASAFFEPLLAAHDRNVVEVFCYAEVVRPDAVTQRMQARADAWRSTVGVADGALARQIHDDGIDILVDLAGHTTGNRLRAFTWKPAPVQASWLGYCATTGLEAMDYWITDDVIHPANTAERSVETILRVPRCWVAYRPPLPAPDVATPERDTVVFGCFNERSKITAATIAVWGRILSALPRAVLHLKARQYADEPTRASLVRDFARHGVTAERLVFAAASTYRDYLAAYGAIDIALDPFPRAGGVTTADALWMGVPVITLCGQRFIERHGASLLHAAGSDAGIAATPEEYLHKALALAHDHAHRRALRLMQRERVAASALCDAHGHARSMEALYRRMWRAFLAGTRLTQ